MSDYNKVIKNEDGITVEELLEVLSHTVKGSGNIFVNIYSYFSMSKEKTESY